MIGGVGEAEEGKGEPKSGALLISGTAETPAEALFPKLNPPEVPVAGALAAAAVVLAAAEAAAEPNESSDRADDAGAAASRVSFQKPSQTH